jgi:hypothetical protein
MVDPGWLGFSVERGVDVPAGSVGDELGDAQAVAASTSEMRRHSERIECGMLRTA